MARHPAALTRKITFHISPPDITFHHFLSESSDTFFAVCEWESNLLLPRAVVGRAVSPDVSRPETFMVNLSPLWKWQLLVAAAAATMYTHTQGKTLPRWELPSRVGLVRSAFKQSCGMK